MSLRKSYVAALVWAISSSCKSSPTEAPSPSAAPAASRAVSLAEGAWTSSKACMLLDREDAVAALGEQGLRNVKKPDNGEQKDSPVVECTYNRGAEPGFVRVSIDVPSRHEDFGKGYPPEVIAHTPVAGVGDAAVQSEATGMGFIMYVKKGNVTFWVQAQTNDKGEKDKALVRAIARKAAARL